MHVYLDYHCGCGTSVAGSSVACRGTEDRVWIARIMSKSTLCMKDQGLGSDTLCKDCRVVQMESDNDCA